jgi:putative ABC transport system permease protein
MKRDQQLPPQILLHFFRWFCHPDLRSHIEGDLIELYYERIEKNGKRKADLNLAADVLLLFRPSIIKPSRQNLESYTMYKSYFKIGWRNLYKNKVYSIINIGGLALGMSIAIIIGLIINDELSFNKYHKNYDRIGQIYFHKRWNNEAFTNNYALTGLGTLLANDYSNHFEKVAIMRARVEDHVVAADDRKFTQQGYFTQQAGPEIFTLNMLQGTRDGLKDLRSVFLSRSLAEKLFPGKNALNQAITFDGKSELKVTGVYEDLPLNSEFHDASYFATLDLWLEGWSHLNVWDNYNVFIYVQLRDGASFKGASEAIKSTMLSHIPSVAQAENPRPFVLPMKDWRLNAQFENHMQVKSYRARRMEYYGILGCFVLVLACINFMNLTTARSEKRAKEVGIRKAIGSLRSQLVRQFYSESFLVAMMSFALSILLVAASLPYFKGLMERDLLLPLGEPLLWLAATVFIGATGFLAGSYPALYLSSFSPVKVLKGTFKAGRFASVPRKVLVTLQFTISMVIIIGTAIIYKQIQFGKDRPVGYTREGLLSLHPRSPDFKGKYDALRGEFKKTGVVEEIAEADYSIMSTLGWNGGFDWPGKDKNADDPTFNINTVTFEYGQTIGWDFVAGRDFSREFPSDVSGVVINVSTQKLMGLENPVGQTLTRDRGGKLYNYTILGVINDVIKGRPFHKTDPCLYFLSQSTMDWLYIRMNPNVSAQEALPKIQKAFTDIVPGAPFDYTFADDDYDAKFKNEERIGTMAGIFSVLAIVISCLGLFGLASFVAEQRTKEIGIRKVMGASVMSVWTLLSKDFIVLIILSCVIALPLGYNIMSRWLDSYDFHTTISWHVFAMTVGGTLIITLLTVSYQAIAAATVNPVKSLRSE